MMPFFGIHISQGSVATRLGCGGVFVHDFATNFLQSLTVKEFWKSANIRCRDVTWLTCQHVTGNFNSSAEWRTEQQKFTCMDTKVHRRLKTLESRGSRKDKTGRFSWLAPSPLFLSALTILVGRQKERQACKKTCSRGLLETRPNKPRVTTPERRPVNKKLQKN